MKKSDLVKEACRRSGLGRQEALRAVNATLDAIKQALESGEIIRIKGLGRLELRPKRKGSVPTSTGHPATRPIPRGKAVVLKATKNATVSLNTERTSFDSTEMRLGGNMDKNQENEVGKQQVPLGEGMAMGLDIGTSRLVLASGSATQVKTVSELNAFVTVPYSKFTENILKQNKVNFQHNGNQDLRVFGNEAERFANFFNAEVRRPMLQGTLNPAEEYSLPIIQSILQQLVKKTKKGETLRFSVPGPLRDGGSSDLVYHEGMLKRLLGEMGYDARAINEGLAIVFAELEDENFSGIGISCGGGMCNVCLAFMSVPVITFSIGKAGDYIDRSVASVTGEVPNRIRVIKEAGFDLAASPKNKYESALQIYYDEVIHSLVGSLHAALAETKNLPRIDKPIPIVLSGGTSMPQGFLDRFVSVLKQDDFPLEVSEVRKAGSPLTTTARGCLIAALYDE
jgi:nucleoid DNA-binding protein